MNLSCTQHIAFVFRTAVVTRCSQTTVPINPDHWPCLLELMGTVVHEYLERSRLVSTNLVQLCLF